MPARLLIVLSLTLMCAACAARNTMAPDPVPVRSSLMTTTADARNVITFSGSVYADQSSDKGEPPIADALIEVTDATGVRSTRSDGYGSYTLTVPYGDATITASKLGYESKTWPVIASDLLSRNVTWNFSLAPM